MMEDVEGLPTELVARVERADCPAPGPPPLEASAVAVALARSELSAP